MSAEQEPINFDEVTKLHWSVRVGLFLVCVASLLIIITSIKNMTQPKQSAPPTYPDTPMQYTVVTVGISKCEYIARRPIGASNWVLVTHRGDCTNCNPSVSIVTP